MENQKLMQELKKNFVAYNTFETFVPGDIVTLKSNMRCARFPGYNQLCVVLEVREGQMWKDDKSNPDSRYFGERADVRLGIVDDSDDDRDFVCHWFPSNRLTKVGNVADVSAE